MSHPEEDRGSVTSAGREIASTIRITHSRASPTFQMDQLIRFLRAIVRVSPYLLYVGSPPSDSAHRRR